MSQIPLQKINIIASREYQEDILRFLQEEALMQVVDLEEDIKKGLAKISRVERRDFDFLLAEVQFAIDFLEAHRIKEKPSLLRKIFSPVFSLTPKQFDRVVKSFYFRDIVEKCKDLEEKINLLSFQENKLKEERELLKDWIALDIRLTDLKKTEKTNLLLGKIPTKNFEGFKKEIVKLKLVHFKEVLSGEDTIKIIIFIGKEEEEELRKVLAKYEFQEVSLPQRKGTAKEELVKIESKIKELSAKTKQEVKEAAKLSRFIPKLQVIYDYLLWGKARQDVQEKIGNTASTFIISGWIAQPNFEILNQGLKKITKGKVEIIKVKPTKGEIRPVAIQNRPFFSNFESVTSIYGLPLPEEIDPTPYLTPFFLIFFGICISDAGYGLILAGLIYLVMIAMRIPKKHQGIYKVLIFGGLATFVAGALLGGWFGIEIEALPSWASSPLTTIRQLDPLKNPVKMLGVALILGVIQIWVGIAIKMFWGIKQKRTFEAILDCAPWLYFLAIALVYFLIQSKFLPLEWSETVMKGIFVGLGLLVLTQGRKQKNIFMKFGQGLMSLYGIAGYLSDVLSYARLLALGLATSVIAIVINLLAGMFRDMIPYLGWVVFVLILIGGHLFNIGINALSAFIHTSRLQFVEFFSKFMEGGGESFRPFSRKHKYVRIEK